MDHRAVSLCEVGPRDGFQFEETPIPTDRKLAWIRALAAAGLPRIQITSFVHPKWVPQMADAEDVSAALLNGSGALPASCTASGLALNARGVARAVAAGLPNVDLSIATNEQHGRDNANMTVDEGVVQAEAMLAEATKAGVPAQLGFQTVWGYAAPGDTPLGTIVDLVRRFSAFDLESISLADSTGMANPDSIKRTVEAVRKETDAPVVLHLHDTRGMGIANIVAALDAGVRRFDTSLGGLGGCPFIPGATGNVATEDVAYAVGELGYSTGIDLAAVAAVSREVADFLGHPLSGRMSSLE